MKYLLSSIHGIYDGDTFKARFIVNETPSEIMRIRVKDIDCPEIKGRSDYERDLAIKARDATRGLLREGKRIIANVRGVDKYDRVLCDIDIDGISLKNALINQGLAKTYEGEKRVWNIC